MGFATGLKANKAYRASQKGNKEEAMRLYEECFNEGLNDSRYMLAYALLMIRDGQYEKAKEFLVAHQKANGMTADQRTTMIVDYSVCCAKLGQMDKAIAKMEEQFRKTPTGLLYQTLGYLYVDRYDQRNREAFLTDAAAKLAEKAAEENAAEEKNEEDVSAEKPETEQPLTPEQQWQAGVDRAVAFNRTAVDYDDEDAVCLDNMGQLYYRVLGDKAAAKEWFDKALAIKPGQIDTLYFLSRYDLDAGDKAAACEKLETAAEGRFSPLNYCTKDAVEAEIAQLKGAI